MDASAIVALAVGIPAIGVTIWLFFRGDLGKVAGKSERAVRRTAKEASKALGEAKKEAKKALGKVANKAEKEIRRVADRAEDRIRRVGNRFEKQAEGAANEVGDGIRQQTEEATKKLQETADRATKEVVSDAKETVGQAARAAVREAEETIGLAEQTALENIRQGMEEAAENAEETVGQAANSAAMEAREAVGLAAARALKKAEDAVGEAKSGALESIEAAAADVKETWEEARRATEAVAEAGETLKRAEQAALDEIGQAAGRLEEEAEQAANRMATDAEEAVRQAAKLTLANVEEDVGRAAAGAMAMAVDAVGKVERRALDTIKSAEADAVKGVQQAVPRPTDPVPADLNGTNEQGREEAEREGVDPDRHATDVEVAESKKAVVPAPPAPTGNKDRSPWVKRLVLALVSILAFFSATWAILALRHPTTQRVGDVTELLATILADSRDIAAVDDSIAHLLRYDSIPPAACQRVNPASAPSEDSTARLSVLDYLARYRFPAMGLCSTTRNVVRRSELFGVLRVDKVTDLVAWTDNENADSTIVLAVSYDALPATAATESDLWPLGVSLLVADSLLSLNGALKKNLVMTITNIHEWRRLRASARNRSVIDKGHDNYVVKLNDDIVRAPFLPLVPPERPQLTIGLLGPANLAYPDSVAEARLLGVSPLDVAILPMDTAGARTRGVLRIPEPHPSDCCANDQLLAAAHDLLALPQAEPNGGSWSARARLDWLDGAFTLMRVQSIAHRNHVYSWLPNIIWVFSVSFTVWLLVIGIRTVRERMRAPIECAQGAIGEISTQIQSANTQIGDLVKRSRTSQKDLDEVGKRINALTADIAEGTRRWWSFLRPRRLGNRIKYRYRGRRVRRLKSELETRRKAKETLDEDKEYMTLRLESHLQAREDASGAMIGDVWTTVKHMVQRTGGHIVLLGFACGAVAIIGSSYAGHLGVPWPTIAAAVFLLALFGGVLSRKRAWHQVAGFAMGAVLSVYLYFSTREAPFPGEDGEWDFNAVQLQLLVLGVGVVLLVREHMMGGGGGHIEDEEAEIVRRTLKERIAGAPDIGGTRKLGLAVLYLVHLLLLFGTEAVVLLDATTIVGSGTSFADAMPVATVTFVVMAFPLAVFLGRRNDGGDGRAKSPVDNTHGGEPAVQAGTDAEERSKNDDE